MDVLKGFSSSLCENVSGQERYMQGSEARFKTRKTSVCIRVPRIELETFSVLG